MSAKQSSSSKKRKRPPPTIILLSDSSDDDDDATKCIPLNHMYQKQIVIATPSLGVTINDPSPKHKYATIVSFHPTAHQSLQCFPLLTSIISVRHTSTAKRSAKQVADMLGSNRPVTLTLQCSTYSWVSTTRIAIVHLTPKLGITINDPTLNRQYAYVSNKLPGINPCIKELVPLLASLISVNNVSTLHKDSTTIKQMIGSTRPVVLVFDWTQMQLKQTHCFNFNH